MKTLRWLAIYGTLTLALQGCIVELTQQNTPAPDSSSTGEDDDTTGGATSDEGDPGDKGTTTGGPFCDGAPQEGFLRTGVCAAAAAAKCDLETLTWDVADHTQLAGYEAGDELTCDGKDNDCDGQTDEGLTRACPEDGEGYPGLGLCEGKLSQACVDGDWASCAAIDLAGHESEEQSCDDVDNDCDGETDESLLGVPSVVCPGAKFWGQCSAIDGITCQSGEWQCDPAAYFDQLALYEAEVELSCDGLDNDCDGEVDEGIVALADSSCDKQGVCEAGGVAAECVTGGEGEWTCNYDDVVGHESVETKCDGLDNDCDGQVDEVQPGLAQCDPSSQLKADKGVCAGQGVALCLNTSVVCDFNTVKDYEEVEVTCDNLDNDCDGTVDNLADGAAPPAGFCPQVGACAAGLDASCAGGVWVCNYSSDKYEQDIEKSCDGIDNDCDGQTDENIPGGPSDCTNGDKGVCKDAAVFVSCGNDDWVCDYGFVETFEEGKEISCDGLDNNCDGVVDEDISDLKSSTCDQLGVCKGSQLIEATCDEGGSGTWSCDYKKLALLGEYDGKVEVQCDGKDNDCDGTVDEDITLEDPDPELTGCPNQGACAGQVDAFCVNGAWKCNVLDVQGYESPEKTCDQIDNDCDGQTDEASCEAPSPCQQNFQCVSNICREAPDDETTFCVSDNSHCPLLDGSKELEAGQTTCVEQPALGGGVDYYISTCTTSGWQQASEPCEEGACANGICKTCTPGAVVCLQPKELLVCDETGDVQNPLACTGETSCLTSFQGLCLVHDDTKLDLAVQPGEESLEVAVALSDDAWLVAFAAGQPDKHTSVGRRLNTADSAVAVADYIVPTGGATDKRNPAILPWAGADKDYATVFVWQEVNAVDPGNLRMRMVGFEAPGQFQSTLQIVNEVLGQEQSHPQIAKKADGKGFVVVWQSAAQVAGFDIFARAYSVKNLSAPYEVTADAAGEQLVNGTTDDDQTRPRIVRLADGRFVVAWTDATETNSAKTGIAARFLTEDGAPTGDEFVLHELSPPADKADVRLAAFEDGAFIAVWTRDVEGNRDVFMRIFKADGTPETPEILVTKDGGGLPKAGIQHQADVAVVPGTDDFVIVWNDSTPPDDPSGTGILLQQFRRTTESLPMRQVNKVGNAVQGDQRHPRVAIEGDGVPYALVVFESADGNATSVSAVYSRPMILQ